MKQVVIHATFGPGIEAAIRRVQARDRKRASRADVAQRIELNLPEGTAAALKRVCDAAGDVPLALLSQQIHKLLAGNRAAFDGWVRYGNDVAGVVARHIDKVGAAAPGEDDE